MSFTPLLGHLKHPQIDPVLVTLGPYTWLEKSIGPLEIHWYGVMYLLAFGSALLIGFWRLRRPDIQLKTREMEDLIVYGAVGVVVGGRLGYVLFYNFGRFLDDPMWLFRIWEGGMAFHGGLLGVVVALALYSFHIKRPLAEIGDFVAPLVPLGLGFGRIGNFINQELWGRATTVPWGVVFPAIPEEATPRHPSQLYQAGLEGLLLFVIVFWFSAKPRPSGSVAGIFLIFYGIFRFAVEFVREPDVHVKTLLFGWMTRGQLLCLPMIVCGIWLLLWAYQTRSVANRVRSVKRNPFFSK